MNRETWPDDDATLDSVPDFGTVPPPAGEEAADVHAAMTAVAPLPEMLLDELRRGRDKARFDFKSKQAMAGEFGNEAPTAPGLHGAAALQPLAEEAPEPDEPTAAPPVRVRVSIEWLALVALAAEIAVIFAAVRWLLAR